MLVGAFCGMMIADVVSIGEGPPWASAFGIFIGCLLGITIPKWLVRNSETKGLNKLNASTALLSHLDDDELDSIA